MKIKCVEDYEFFKKGEYYNGKHIQKDPFFGDSVLISYESNMYSVPVEYFNLEGVNNK